MPIVLLETVLGQRDLPELSFLTTRHSEFYWAVIGKQGKEEQCLGWCLTRVGRLIREEAATISHTHTHTHSLTHSFKHTHFSTRRGSYYVMAFSGLIILLPLRDDWVYFHYPFFFSLCHDLPTGKWTRYVQIFSRSEDRDMSEQSNLIALLCKQQRKKKYFKSF